MSEVASPLEQQQIDATLEAFRAALEDFLASDRRNQHVLAGPVVTYLRKGARAIDGRIEQALDLASIQIAPEWQGKGLGSRLLDLIEARNPYPYLFVESIVNPDFAGMLVKRGYRLKEQCPGIDISMDAIYRSGCEVRPSLPGRRGSLRP